MWVYGLIQMSIIFNFVNFTQLRNKISSYEKIGSDSSKVSPNMAENSHLSLRFCESFSRFVIKCVLKVSSFNPTKVFMNIFVMHQKVKIGPSEVQIACTAH